ncbi:carbohydrate ABC transporter permease [Cohnella lupini]|uniref:Raffinose/stachyose/melibiose transport system permease protein n=1 Tax=Cohnella lupini TaxID=1294267 RepID=A0A3D9I312_9BACL|nr:carbohydrate ABC transporter permease [Cohnella lupini]RED55959.1 raffinose/stachyose/melibiose transport system permease protein [Cohnella lupini]
MKRKPKLKLIWTLIGLALALLHLMPLYIAVTVAFKKTTDLSSRWQFPSYLYWDHFKDAIATGHLLRAFGNSLILTVATATLLVLVGSVTAYPLARIKTRLSRSLMNVILGVMMIPTLSIIVPLYSMMQQFQAINTYWGIILVLTTFNLPLCIFLYANFINTIPKELDEAAKVDGCGSYRLFYQIILPQLKPVTAAVIILKGLKVWNDYEFPLYFMQKPQNQTITLAISHFFSDTSSYFGSASAAALMAVVPVVIIFLALQKNFISGLSEGAVK